MKLFAALSLLAFALCGCGEKAVIVSELPEGAESLAKAAPADLDDLDAGDVEATVAIELTLDPASAQGVVVEELRNAKKKLNSLTLTASPRMPAELWTKIDVKTTETFAARPTVLRGKVFREVTPGAKEQIFSFQTVLDGFAAPSRRKAGGEYFPIEFRTDMLAGLSETPATMLVFAEVEAFMSPTGTDPASLDQATYTAGPEASGILMSNPVRVDFVALPVEVPTLDSAVANPLDLTPTTPTEAPAVEVPTAEETPAAAETPAAETPAAETPAAEAPAEPTTPTDAPVTTEAPAPVQ